MAEIDSKMGGGIPKGSLTLVEGQSGAGKSVLTQQIIWGSLHNDLNAVLYTSENTYKSLLRQMDSLNQSVLDWVLLGRFLIFAAQSTSTDGQPTKVLDALLEDMHRQERADLFVIDSITSLVLHTQLKQAITFFENCKDLCDRGKTIIAVAHSYALDSGSLIRIRSMCDAHFNMRIEEVGEELVRVLEIGKIRGAHKSVDNLISFSVEPGCGMQIIPISRTKA